VGSLGDVMGIVLAVIGILQIAFAALAFAGANSNIHEIFAAVLFTGGVLEIGVGAIIAQIGDLQKTGKRLLAVADPQV